MEILVLAVVLGLIPTKIAHDKGESFWVWWVLGTLLWIVATPAAILLKSKRADEPAEEPHDRWAGSR